MSLKIEVSRVEVREVIKKSTGEVFRIPECHGYCHGIDRYPVAIRFGVERGAQHPTPGMYELEPGSFYAGKFGALSLKSALVLRPVVADTKRAA